MESAPQYLADGQSFESRCEAAKTALLDYSKLFVEITDADFKSLAEADARFEQKKSAGGSPLYLELLGRMHNEHKEQIRKYSAEMLKTGWEGAVNVLNVVWGEDAVAFALEAIRYGKKAS